MLQNNEVTFLIIVCRWGDSHVWACCGNHCSLNCLRHPMRSQPKSKSHLMCEKWGRRHLQANVKRPRKVAIQLCFQAFPPALLTRCGFFYTRRDHPGRSEVMICWCLEIRKSLSSRAAPPDDVFNVKWWMRIEENYALKIQSRCILLPFRIEIFFCDRNHITKIRNEER